MDEANPCKKWSEDHSRLIDFLVKLYPSWASLLKGIDDEVILDEVILLLAYYFDCGGPCMFVHPISEIGQVQLDCAKVNLGGQAGEIPLVVNVHRKFCSTPKRERHHWCAQNCVDYATVKKLDLAYRDLKCSTEGHIGHRIIGSTKQTLREKLHNIAQLILRTNPETFYIHDGRPGLFYLNVNSLEHIRMSPDSTLSHCPAPPKYLALISGNWSDKTVCSLALDECSLESVLGNDKKKFWHQLSAALGKVVVGSKLCDCGVRFQSYLTENNCRQLEVLTREIWKHCGCDEDEVHVSPDSLTNSLMLYCPESVLQKAKQVAEDHIKIIKAECEAAVSDIDYPDSTSLAAYLASGGYLAETDSQPTFNRTFILWITSPEERRKAMDGELTEKYVKDNLLKDVKDITAVRKFQEYPESAMWGLVIMKDTMACKEAIRNFNRIGSKYRLHWLNNEMNEIVLMFSIEKKLKNKIWVKFTTDRDFAVAKRFPWNEYWVMDAFFFDDRQAKFVFKRDRNDLYRLRNDIADLANVGVVSVKHETISPLRWPEEDLKFVEDELEAKFKTMNYLESYDMQFLSRKPEDTQWQGVARFESYHKHIPDQFHRDVGSVPLKNGMVFLNNGVRDGLTMKVPRRVYLLLKKEIEEQETDFHGSVGVRVSDADEDTVSIHFIWWNGSKFPDKLRDLRDLLEPACIFGIDRALNEIIHRSENKPFKVMERWFQVAIVAADEAPRLTLIYGKPENRDKAAAHFTSMLAVDRAKEKMCSEIIPLHGPCLPSGLIATVINKYGPTLDKLQILSGCAVIHLDKTSHAILCRGRPSDVQIVKEELDTCCSELIGNNWKGLFTQVRECVACLCPIEDPRNPAYHLEICGHTYCSECLMSQVKTQLSQKMLPITCVAEDCETKFCTDDILAACMKSGEGTDKLVEVALQHHLSRNRNICKPCSTPDCPVMYHSAVDDDMKFNCPHCDKETCIGCHEKWHAGFSCEIKKEIDNLEDEKLKTWILKRPKFRKMCPSCKTGVEKMGGCDNVHCSSCATSMCWRCLAFFKTSGECYDHIARQHRNEPAEIDNYSDDELVDYEEN